MSPAGNGEAKKDLLVDESVPLKGKFEVIEGVDSEEEATRGLQKEVAGKVESVLPVEEVVFSRDESNRISDFYEGLNRVDVAGDVKVEVSEEMAVVLSKLFGDTVFQGKLSAEEKSLVGLLHRQLFNVGPKIILDFKEQRWVKEFIKILDKSFPELNDKRMLGEAFDALESSDGYYVTYPLTKNVRKYLKNEGRDLEGKFVEYGGYIFLFNGEVVKVFPAAPSSSYNFWGKGLSGKHQDVYQTKIWDKERFGESEAEALMSEVGLDYQKEDLVNLASAEGVDALKNLLNNMSLVIKRRLKKDMEVRNK